MNLAFWQKIYFKDNYMFWEMNWFKMNVLIKAVEGKLISKMIIISSTIMNEIMAIVALP